MLCFFTLAGCGEQAEISFVQGITLDGNNIYSEVDNNVDTFTFNGKVNIKSGFSFVIYKDKEGLFEIPTNTLDLDIGDNIYYLLLKDNNDNKTLYTINVRRLPMYTISLYTYSGVVNSNGSYSIVLYKTISVQENSKLNLSNENPTRTGYDFVSWEYNLNEVVTGNKSIYSEWEAHRHIVYVGSKQYESVYGEYLTLPRPENADDPSSPIIFRGYQNEQEGYYFNSSGQYIGNAAGTHPVRFYVDKDITVSEFWGQR